MASLFFFVKKKDGKLQPCQDYQYLNDWTVKNTYPLQLISEFMDKLKGAKYFSKMDVRWGYNNIQIRQGDEWKVAFKTNKGLFEPTVMFFGMCNSPATFQSMMDMTFEDIIERGCMVIYMDDVMILFFYEHMSNMPYSFLSYYLHVLFHGHAFLLSYDFLGSFRNRKYVENNSGQERTKSGMLPVTDKDLASTYVLCHLSPTCP